MDAHAFKGTFVDCGANRGNITAWVLHHAPRARVVAIEANPQLVPALRARFAGDTHRVEVVHGAVWTHSRGIDLYLTDPGMDPAREGATVCGGKTTNRVDYARGVAVPSVDMHAMISTLAIVSGEPIALKLDIEGAEYAVLERMMERGSLHLLGGLIVETHAHKVSSIGVERHEALLRGLGAWGGEPVARHTTFVGYCQTMDGTVASLVRGLLRADTRTTGGAAPGLEQKTPSMPHHAGAGCEE